MKEFLVDLWPRKGGHPSKVRVFAFNAADAIVKARQMYPDYSTGSAKEL